MARGISASRIETRGYGEAYPVATNDTPAGRQLNRRVEVVLSEVGRTVLIRR
jgi:outer membrane protein OmpA-like peptidoglycan-associated protein